MRAEAQVDATRGRCVAGANKNDADRRVPVGVVSSVSLSVLVGCVPPALVKCGPDDDAHSGCCQDDSDAHRGVGR